MATKRPLRNEYSPVQMWETPRGTDPGRDSVDVPEPAPVLYDANERPVRRAIDYRTTWGRSGN